MALLNCEAKLGWPNAMTAISVAKEVFQEK
jgi:hypothetical protein